MKKGFVKTKYEKRKKFANFDNRSFKRFLKKEEKAALKPSKKKNAKNKSLKKTDPIKTVSSADDGKDSSVEIIDNSIFWKQINQWRQKQSEEDYKLADAIRTHCKLMLNNSIRKDPATNRLESTLKPSHLRMLASIVETVQRVQRLALGLSTENIGVESNVKTEESEGHDVPIFEIQMTEDGRFKNIRPGLQASKQ